MQHTYLSIFYTAKVIKKVGYSRMLHHYFIIFDMKYY